MNFNNYFSCPYVIEYGTWTDPANQTFTDFFTGFVTHQVSCSPATSPSAPAGTNGSRMNAGTVSLSATTTSGITVDWYANSTGGNVLSGGLGTLSYTTPSISTTTTYFAQTRNISTGCVSSTRTPVVATVNYPTPFTYSGAFYNSQNIGIPNITVSVYYRLKTASSYSLLQTVISNSLGTFSLSTSLDISTYDFQIIIDNITVGNPSLNDVNYFNGKILNQNFNSKDYYRINTNGNNILSISDIYLMHKKINGNLWPNGIPSYRIFTQSEWNIIDSSSNNLISTYPGAQSIILNNPTAGGSSVYYLIKTGHTN